MATVKKPATTVKTVSGHTISTAKQHQQQPPPPVTDLAFGKENYRLMLIGLGIIILGFVLMSGGKLDDPAAFNPEIFSFRRISLAPIVVIAGFLVEVFAIIKKSRE